MSVDAQLLATECFGRRTVPASRASTTQTMMRYVGLQFGLYKGLWRAAIGMLGSWGGA